MATTIPHSSCCNFYLWGYLKYKIYAINPQVLQELKAGIRRGIDCILEDELMHVNAHFLRRYQNRVDEGRHF